MLSIDEIATFVRDGFVAVRGAVGTSTIEACVDVIWEELATRGVSRGDPGTWTLPVVRIDCPEGGPFVDAGTAPLLWEAYDQLIGLDRWAKRDGVGGTIPIRFPHPADPGDAGWHVEGSFTSDAGSSRTNIRSQARGLLAIFLLTDVGPDDAPTRLRVGSHADAARVLEPAGDDGYGSATLSPLVDAASEHQPLAHATGSAGDVYLCHPFVVHAASWPHRGIHPRMIAQPGVYLLKPFPLIDRSNAYPVERAILDSISDRD